ELGHLAAARHQLILVQVLDPKELTFDFDKASHYRDAETGDDLYIDPRAAKAQYQEKFTAHQEALKKIAGSCGAKLHQFSTDQPLEKALSDLVEGH
ncbi:MAG: DUF58 domain-containing protein, partial [Verrucomicrobiota bacterium]